MTSAFSKAFKPALVSAALALFVVAGFLQNQLNRQRSDPELGLTRVAPLDPDQAPPMLAFTTMALGSFRGLIANALWMRASDLQDEGKYFEMVQLADWITKLEPTFAQVWLVQAWNMAYNISVKFTDPADRWQWVQRGIELLRDDGLRYNPKEALVYRELAWFFQHKMGQNFDDAHVYYKTEWAREMTRLFGGPRPNYTELLNPQTEEARQRLETLRTRYKMEPRLMKQLEDTYGPLEWRLPEAHAIYWASLGLAKVSNKDLLMLRRAIYQSLQLAVYRGRVVRLPATGLIETGPDFDKMKLANAGFEKMIAEEELKKDAIRGPQRSFLREAIYLLYTCNRQADANYWLGYLREHYPDAVPPNLTLEEFAFERLVGNLASLGYDKTKAVIEGLIRQSYRSLAVGDDDRANGWMAMARQLWGYYKEKAAGQQQRLPMPPYEGLQKSVLESMLGPDSQLAPELIPVLRSRLGLPASSGSSTNAPPAKS